MKGLRDEHTKDHNNTFVDKVYKIEVYMILKNYTTKLMELNPVITKEFLKEADTRDTKSLGTTIKYKNKSIITINLNLFYRLLKLGWMSQDGMIERIKKTITHEYVHALIYEEVGRTQKEHLPSEERIARILSGEVETLHNPRHENKFHKLYKPKQVLQMLWEAIKEV